MPTITEDDTILKGLRTLFKRDAKRKNGPVPRRMSELCLKLKLIEDGETVPSRLSAKVRGRLRRLEADGTCVRDGAKATTTYTACT